MTIPMINVSILNGSNGFRLEGPGGGVYGSSVNNVGDINGDGFDDVVVNMNSSYRYAISASYVVFGKATGFSAATDLFNLDGNNGFRLANRGYSLSVNNAGDMNGDGFDDLIVNTGSTDYVVFGKASGFDARSDLSGLDGSNSFSLYGVVSTEYSDSSVSSAGDVNGDGFDDLFIGDRVADSNGKGSGSSYVVFGKAAGFGATLNLSSLDGNDGFRLDGVGLGRSVSSTGDVNSDGFDDLIIGAPDAQPNSAIYVVFGGNFFTGEAVYLGTAGNDNLTGTTLAERFEAGDGNDRMTGLGAADIFHGDSGDDIIAAADLDFQLVDGGAGSDILELTGESINLDLANFHDTIDGIETIDLTGSGDNTLTLTLPDLLSLSDTTDTFTVNGDAGDDVVGLSDGWTDGGNDGDYRIFTHNGTTLRVHRDVHTDVPIADVINVADLDGNNGFRLDGAELDSSGASVSSAGDVNGDGFADVIVGAPGTHASYVVFGKSSGFDAAMDLSGLDGSNGFRLDAATSGNSVSSAGDVNGDGFDDVIIGAYRADLNGIRSGSSYVVFGKASGFEAVMNVSDLVGRNGFRLDGAHAYDFSGQSVSGAGDVNGDGFDDLLVGAPATDSNGENSGSSYIIFGRSDFSGGQLPEIVGTPKSDVLRGTSAAEIFKAGGGHDLLIGHGGADVFEGEAGNDYIRVSDLGFDSVDGGTGKDILGLGGNGLNLNLTDMGNKISDIETIYLFGTGDNTLTLTGADVLNLSSTSNTLKVNGNTGDQIDGLNHGWKDGGIHGGFHTFTHDAAVLLVGVNVATDFV